MLASLNRTFLRQAGLWMPKFAGGYPCCCKRPGTSTTSSGGGSTSTSTSTNTSTSSSSTSSGKRFVTGCTCCLNSQAPPQWQIDASGFTAMNSSMVSHPINGTFFSSSPASPLFCDWFYSVPLSGSQFRIRILCSGGSATLSVQVDDTQNGRPGVWSASTALGASPVDCLNLGPYTFTASYFDIFAHNTTATVTITAIT